jgi:8-oxo-dGTP pyrophosphatase MutT (NUDIX family)
MIQEIRKFLGVESLQEKLNRFQETESKLKETDQELDDLAKSFCIEKGMYENRLKDPDNVNITDRIKDKFDIFCKAQKEEIKKAKKQYDSLNKEMDSLQKDKDISKAIKEVKKQESYNKIKKSFKDGSLPEGIFNEVVNKLAKRKVTEYADVIVLNEDNELLLIERSKYEDANAGAWVIPGGHVDPGEDFKTAAIRELSEESGIEVTDAEEVGEYKDNKAHIKYFKVEVNQIDHPILLDLYEGLSYKWVTLDKIEDEEMVFNMRDNVMKMLDLKKKNIEVIKKAIKEGIIPIEKAVEILKGGKVATLGEVRTWGDGYKYKKTTKGWIKTTDGKSNKSENKTVDVDSLTVKDFNIKQMPIGTSISFGKEDRLLGFLGKYSSTSIEERVEEIKKENKELIAEIIRKESGKSDNNKVNNDNKVSVAKDKKQTEIAKKPKKEDANIGTEEYKLDNDNYQYFIRYSNNIEEDLKRGWSSWNFGGDGYEGTKDNLVDEINEIKDSEEGGEFQISGFNVWIDKDSDISVNKDAIYVDDHEIKELYDNYWVVVDNVNAKGELSAHVLPDNLDKVKDVVKLVSDNKSEYDGTGDGESFDASKARVVYSKGDMCVIEVGDEVIKSEENDFDTLEKAFKQGIISEEVFEKARSGVYADNAKNKRLKRVGQQYGSTSQKETKEGKTAAKDEEKGKGSSTDDLSENAKKASVAQLEVAIKESDDPKLREAANAELDRREKEEKPQEKKEGESKKDDKENNDKEKENKDDNSKGEIKDLTGKFIKADEVKTGQPFKMTFTHNTDKAGVKFGSEFGQDIEPHGKYMTNSDGGYKIPGWEYGEIEFKNPLVLEHVSTNSSGWKGELVNKFGKKGKQLSKELAKRGYDSIVTVDSKYNELSEIVSLKDFNPNYKDKRKTIEKNNKGSKNKDNKEADLSTKEGIEAEIKTIEGKNTDKLFKKLSEGKFKKLNRASQGKLIVASQKETIDKGTQLIQNFTENESDAMDIYASSMYQDINGYLRGIIPENELHKDVLKSIKSVIVNIDSAINKNELSEDLVVYRGVDESKIESGKDNAYKSTSLEPYIAYSFARGEKPTIKRYIIPKGTKYAYMGGAEKEILFGRDFDINKYIDPSNNVKELNKAIESKEKNDLFIEGDIEKSEKNKIKGGKADGMSLQDIADKHKVGLDKLKKQFLMGVKVEMEHTNKHDEAVEIAMDHLVESAEYYTKLAQMESTFKEKDEKK